MTRSSDSRTVPPVSNRPLLDRRSLVAGVLLLCLFVVGIAAWPRTPPAPVPLGSGDVLPSAATARLASSPPSPGFVRVVAEFPAARVPPSLAVGSRISIAPFLDQQADALVATVVSRTERGQNLALELEVPEASAVPVVLRADRGDVVVIVLPPP